MTEKENKWWRKFLPYIEVIDELGLFVLVFGTTTYRSVSVYPHFFDVIISTEKIRGTYYVPRGFQIWYGGFWK